MFPKPSSQGAESSPIQSSANKLPGLLSKRLVTVLFSVGVVLSGLGYGLAKYVPLSVPTPSAQLVGLADYESLEPGMTLVEARSILGKGIEVSRSETEANFVWLNPNGSKITAVFSGGKLKSKAQEGLK